MANVLIIERVAVSLFKHTLNGEQAAMDNNPNLTSFLEVSSGLEFLDFKTTNGAPLVKNQRIKPSEITIVDTFGGTGTFTGYTAALPIWNKLAELNYFVGYGIDGAAASQAFKNLTDIFPNGSFFGQNGKVYMVNESLQRLEATTFYNKRLFSELDDVATGTLDSGMSGKILQISIVSGQPKITLTNLPGLSDSQKQTYRIRFSSTDAPDEATVLSLLQAYTSSPFDAGIIPNDMGGILVEVYDSGDDSTVAIYELTGISAGSSLSTLIDDNIIKFGTGTGGASPIQDVLEAGNTAYDIGVNFTGPGGKEVNVGNTKVSASDTSGNASEFDAEKITVLNTGTGVNTKMYNDRIEYFDGNTTTVDFEATTQDNTHVIPNKSGTFAHLSDILSRALTGLSLVTGGIISASNTILEALGKLQNQITGLTTSKQDTLVSGTNIKTVDGNTLLGSGNIQVSRKFAVALNRAITPINPTWYVTGAITSVSIATDSTTSNLVTALSAAVYGNQVCGAPYNCKLTHISYNGRGASATIFGVVKGDVVQGTGAMTNTVTVFQDTTYSSFANRVITVPTPYVTIEAGKCVRFSMMHNQTGQANDQATITFFFEEVI